MIVFKDVSVSFDERLVLSGISCTIEPGAFVCLTGPSGAGKSTIVQLLIRALTPSAGTIQVDGADLSALPLPLLQLYRRKTGVLFQDYRLLPDRTVVENIAFALEVADASDDLIEERLIQLLDMLKITHRAEAFPHELSGGELTRTALARALIGNPSILIADEPTGNLDPAQALEIVEILRSINAQGTTVILATHDRTVVDALGVRVIRLEGGRITRDAPGGYDAPAPETERRTAPTAVPAERSVPIVGVDATSESSVALSAPSPSPTSVPAAAPGDAGLRSLPPTGRFVPKPTRRFSTDQPSEDGPETSASGRTIKPTRIES